MAITTGEDMIVERSRFTMKLWGYYMVRGWFCRSRAKMGILGGDFSRDCSQKKPDRVREAVQGESQAMMRAQL